MLRLVRRLIADEDGQDLIEYALLGSVVGLVAVAAWNAIQWAIANTYSSWDNGVNNLWEPQDPVGGGS